MRSIFTIIAFLLVAANAYASNIQMLPPTLPNSGTVCSGGNRTLVYSGDSISPHSGINCVPVTIDNGGNVTTGANVTASAVNANTMTATGLISGATITGTNSVTGNTVSGNAVIGTTVTGDTVTANNALNVLDNNGTHTLSGPGVDAADGLSQTPVCDADKVLTKTGDSTFACVAVADVKAGLRGPTGPQGAAGPQGVQGPPGTVSECQDIVNATTVSCGNGGASSCATATCPAGWMMTGGGCEGTGYLYGGYPSKGSADAPNLTSGASPASYSCAYAQNGTVIAHAMCCH